MMRCRFSTFLQPLRFLLLCWFPYSLILSYLLQRNLVRGTSSPLSPPFSLQPSNRHPPRWSPLTGGAWLLEKNGCWGNRGMRKESKWSLFLDNNIPYFSFWRYHPVDAAVLKFPVVHCMNLFFWKFFFLWKPCFDFATTRFVCRAVHSCTSLRLLPLWWYRPCEGITLACIRPSPFACGCSCCSAQTWISSLLCIANFVSHRSLSLFWRHRFKEGVTRTPTHLGFFACRHSVWIVPVSGFFVLCIAKASLKPFFHVEASSLWWYCLCWRHRLSLRHRVGSYLFPEVLTVAIVYLGGSLFVPIHHPHGVIRLTSSHFGLLLAVGIVKTNPSSGVTFIAQLYFSEVLGICKVE